MKATILLKMVEWYGEYYQGVISSDYYRFFSVEIEWP